MSNKQTEKLLALNFMSPTNVEKTKKRKSINVVTITAMESHSKERYDELQALKFRLDAVKSKCAKKQIRFSVTAFAVEAVTKALDELEKQID